MEKVGRGLAAGDVDNDGDLDLLVTNNGAGADLLVNQMSSTANALLVRLVGTDSNRDAIGARVRLTVGARTLTREVKAGSSYLSQNDIRQHFGLGTARRADRLEILWPRGRVETLTNVPANEAVVIREGAGIVERAPLRRLAGG